ncbi:alpha/beta hydrolase [Nocardioides sp. DS6]|uniref:Alpha/beta hydrolase n=1 Tax=Nocardioides eburneus TaxID=3231482 RepID=A0ABV3SZA1_9ACTN
MTLLHRPTPMPAWTADPAAVTDYGTEILALSAVLDDCGSFASGGARCPSWTGDGGTAYATGVAGLGRRADALSLASRDVGNKVVAHAEELADLHGRHVDLSRRERELDRLVAQVAVAGEAGVVWGLFGIVGPAALDQMLAAYEADRRTWISDLAAAEQAIVRALSRTLTASDVQRTYADLPDPADAVAHTVPGAGASPARMRAWWAGLTLAEQQALIAAHPELVGNRDGLPAWARNAANAVALDRDLATVGAVPPELRTPEEQARYDHAVAADEARQAIEDQAVDVRTGDRVSPQIYLYDPAAFGGDGAIAMSVGDLDTADNVAVTVPGFGTDMDSAPFQATRAIALHQAMQFESPTGQAAMFWIGYDAPDNLPWDGGLDAAGVVTERMAAAGGDRLADTLDGLDAMRDHPAHLTVVGHSYGSTTVGHALHDHHTGVDDAVFVGSPGVGGDTRTAADLDVPAGHVWAGADSRDPITRLGDTGAVGLGTVGGGGLGRNPVEDGFGAIRFQAESITHGGLFDDHGKYFDPDTESLANISHVATGDYGRVTTAPGVHDPGPDVGDAWDAAEHAAGAGGHLLHGLTHPWDQLGDLAAAGQDLAQGGADLGGPLEDPEAGRAATSPRTHGA